MTDMQRTAGNNTAEVLTPKQRISIFSVIIYALLALGLIVSVLPFYWLVVMSTRTTADMYAYPPKLIPGGELANNVRRLFDNIDFWSSFTNTLIVATTTSAFTIFLCSLAGFTFAKFKFPGRNLLFVLVLATMMVPTQLNTVPSFVIMSYLGWVGSLLALIVPGIVTAFGIFWMRQYASTAIPDDLIDSGRLDGANHFDLYRVVAVPLLRPAIAFLGIFTFVNTWNDYMWPLVVLIDPARVTLQVALASMQGLYQTDYSMVMAGTLLSTLPLIVIFVLGSKHFIGNIAAGAVKA